MSSATKKKHVTEEVLNHYDLPQHNQLIVKVIAGRGNNLHEVVTPDGDNYLVSMPPKFRKWIWIKRGDYLIVDPIEEGNKVKAEITSILLKDQIKYIKDEGKWPPEFEDKNSTDEDINSDQLFRNTNHRDQDIDDSSSSSESDEEDNEEEADDEEEEEDKPSQDSD
ncbi:unnamed protein product [Medioppia subpectinata]|uniref:Probable RNA-binding protein EIF1AD n=1 Tax=Medioppia subpectinata TaxID=1979941 RepID=A0A7R9KF94_9ACAR|nr:unnamed protein product [Medioppia subpectinata]CAG2102484.1 unnamed protein product [Medioppia subpectinata]